MTNAPLSRIAVIGLGMATRPHLDALVQLQDRVEVAGVFNRTRAKADSVSRTYGFPVFESLDAIATDAGTDAVIIATPPNQRLDIVTAMAAAGKHILMEKPVERTFSAASQIVNLCEEYGVTLGIVFQHRFREAALRLRTLIAENALGDLALVRAEIPWWRGQDYYDVQGRGTLERDGGGVLISQAIHVLDLMLSLTGPAKSVQAFTATTKLHRMESEDFVSAGLTFASGLVGSVVATTATYPGEEERLVLDGTKANALLQGGRLTVTWRDGRTEHIGAASGTGGGADPMAFPCDWHRDLILDFVQSVNEGRAPVITGQEALRVHALIATMIRSGQEGRQIDVENT